MPIECNREGRRSGAIHAPLPRTGGKIGTRRSQKPGEQKEGAACSTLQMQLRPDMLFAIFENRVIDVSDLRDRDLLLSRR